MEKFLVISSDNNYTLNIFDFEKMKIVRLHNGVFTDETDNCQKLTKRKQTVIGGFGISFYMEKLTENRHISIQRK